MNFGRKNHLVGVDLGSSLIKIAELKITGAGYGLHKFGMSKIPPGTIVEGRIADMKGLATKIRSLFKSQKIRKKNVAISTGGHSVVIKVITTDAHPEKKLHDAIYSEAEQYIPYDIDDVNIDYQILGENKFSPNRMNILIVAAKKDLVAEYIELIQLAGLNLRIMDVDIFALQNIHEILPYERQGKIDLIVDIGASRTSLNILRAHSSLMLRDAEFGTNQILETLSNQYDVTIEEAEMAMNGELKDMMNPENIQEIRHRVIQSWTAEICEVVNTYQSSAKEESIEKIILSGGGVFVEGFKDRLISELDADVSIINPFESLIVNRKKFPDSFITNAAPLAPIAIGLALRRTDDK